MSQARQQKILLVDDDRGTALVLSQYLERRGFLVEYEANGKAAVSRIIETQPAAVVLEAALPGKDGFAICREVRPHYHGPIIMVTGLTQDKDHVLGLEVGADDYISKPADPRVVLAHIESRLRRNAAAGGEASEYRFGQLRIVQTTRSVFLGSQEILFTTAEFDLLWLFASHAGSILSRDDIMKHLRGGGHRSANRSIDMRISRLRKRLGDDTDNPRRIKTIRGQGYLFSPTDWD